MTGKPNTLALLIQEKERLQQFLSEGKEFIFSEEFNNLPKLEQGLRAIQIKAMHTYSTCLDQWIYFFKTYQ